MQSKLLQSKLLQSRKKVRFARFLPAAALVAALSQPAYSQCTGYDVHSQTDTATANSEIQQRYNEKNWAAVVQLA